jgi:hypothetical protein
MKITSLTIADEAPHGWEDGEKLLAVFDYQDAGYLLKDALLIRGGRSVDGVFIGDRGQLRPGPIFL